MPSLERGPSGPPPEQEPRREQELLPYHLAARFPSERPASRAYNRLQDLIFQREDADLSAYRFLFNQVSHVAVIGAPPAEDLEQRLHGILSAGEPVTLPANVLQALYQRREEAKRQGPWFEGHYRPGRPL